MQYKEVMLMQYKEVMLMPDHLENGNFLNVGIAYNLLIVHVHAQIRCVTE